jgi:hypothetical protein
MQLGKSIPGITGMALAVVLLVVPAFAETVKPLNPDCEICPVVIFFDSNETKAMLGQEAVDLLRKVIAIGERTTKLDLDGMLRPGSDADSNSGYELTVNAYRHFVSIRSNDDGATIKLKTDYRNIGKEGVPGAWSPKIQLSAPSHNQIERTDDLDVAWRRFDESMLAYYINGSHPDRTPSKQKLGSFIIGVLQAIAA